jgi:hypothetical protein
LFEEIDEDVYPIDRKGTFRADDDGTSAYGADEQQDGYGAEDGVMYNNNKIINGAGGMVMDEQSIDTGVLTNPSGVLGVQHRHDGGGDAQLANLAAGLGIQTPASRDYAMGRYGDGIEDTPISTSDRPLGIASMRDQQDDANESKGLAHMIMERLAQYSGSKN